MIQKHGKQFTTTLEGTSRDKTMLVASLDARAAIYEGRWA
jgi:hypothetical protein